MTFYVEPPRLKAMAKGMDSLSDSAKQAKAYAAHTEPSSDNGELLASLWLTMSDVRGAVEGFFERLDTLAESCGDELVAVARSYEDSDRGAVERATPVMGALGAGAPVPPIGSGSDAGCTAGVLSNPSQLLTTPHGENPYPGGVEQALHFTDLASPGYWLFKLLDRIGAPDIPGEIGEFFIGDWESWARSSDAMRHLGEFLGVASDNIGKQWMGVAPGWSGPAASSAEAYFARLADTIAGYKDDFDTVAEELDTMVISIKAMVASIGSLITLLADLALAFMAEMIAGAATSWTGVGAAASAAAVAATVWKATQVVRQILEIKGKAMIAVDAVIGVCTLVGSNLWSLGDLPLPQAYEGPGVPA